MDDALYKALDAKTRKRYDLNIKKQIEEYNLSRHHNKYKMYIYITIGFSLSFFLD